MKLKCLLFSLLSGFIITTYGQETINKLNIETTMSYSILGEGDYGGFFYDNSISYSVRSSFQICASIGFLISANDGVNDINLSHNSSHIIGDLFFRIIPIKTKILDLHFGFGNSNRYRSEIVFQSLFIHDQESNVKYNNKTSFDFGYMGQVELGFKISPKMAILLNGELHGYIKGTPITSLGLGVNIKL